jgi:YfiH family protein
VRLGPAHVVFTGRAEGDLGSRGAWRETHELDFAIVARRHAVVDRPWSWLHQVHGNRVAVVTEPGGAAGEAGDGLVTATEASALAVFTADCAPVALAADNGFVGVAHGGWRGITDGIIESTVETMRELGATGIVAALGPCIHAECYEFSPEDLDTVAARLGDGVRSTTKAGAPALDVPAAVRAALEGVDVPLVHDEDVCTACSSAHFSHRARRDAERQATVVWVP